MKPPNLNPPWKIRLKVIVSFKDGGGLDVVNLC